MEDGLRAGISAKTYQLAPSLGMKEPGQAELVDQIAQQIHRWGVADIAATLIDGCQPLAFLLGQLLWVAQPAVGWLADPGRFAAWAHFLEQPEAIAALRTRLEEI
jgi:hypothetical protein